MTPRRLHLVVSAGPTREPLDAVRFLSNASSGRMGFAVARAARDRGHRVTLVTGPVVLRHPAGVEVVPVVTAREMHAAVLAAFEDADALVMTAAVSDYRPARPRAGKWKKGAARMDLPLVRNPDIVAAAGRRKGGRCVIGFAVEVADALRHARAKIAAKHLDALLLCDPGAFAARGADYRLVLPDGSVEPLPGISKPRLARRVVRFAEAHAGPGSAGRA